MDSKYNIISFSDYFIPTSNNNHLPYLLTFPSGITQYENNYYISYGEGDEKTKILELSKDEIKNILKTSNQKMTFLDEKYVKPKVLHLGYFGQWNCGDDAFVKVFKYLNKINTSYQACFTNDGFDYKLKVLGGGDVINDYFISTIANMKKNSLVAFGVGIPYLNQTHLLDNFEEVVLRNKNDVNNLLLQTPNVSYLPDIVWLMSKFYKPKKLFVSNAKYKIGLALPRTYFNDKFIPEYRDLILELGDLLKILVKKYSVYLIPFGINDDNNKENDNLLTGQLHELVPETILCEVDKNDSYVENIFDLVNSMDLMICGRFHAHIFSAICQTPFVSLSCSRKCEELMMEWDMEDYLYKFETNQIIIPVNFSHTQFYDWIKDKINSPELKYKVDQVYKYNTEYCDKIINKWNQIIKKYN